MQQLLSLKTNKLFEMEHVMQEKFNIQYSATLNVDSGIFNIKNRLYDIKLSRNGAILELKMGRSNHELDAPTFDDCIVKLVNTLTRVKGLNNVDSLAKRLNFDIKNDVQRAHLESCIEEWRRLGAWFKLAFKKSEINELFENYSF